jgi:hypothetical protein
MTAVARRKPFKLVNIVPEQSLHEAVAVLRRYIWTDAADRMVQAGYERGDDARVIAARIGVTPSAVHNRAKILGQPHRRKNRTMEQRFWDYVSPEPNSGCWLWDGSYDRKGYGQLRIAAEGPGALRYATHIALELAGRPVPPRFQACHRCDVSSCVNPSHLFIGTPQQNTDDMISKGRMRAKLGPRGSNVFGAKLHESDIPNIRLRLAAGETLRSIGSDYGVSEALISAVRLRKIWRHVD